MVRSLSRTRIQVGQVVEANQPYLRERFPNRQNRVSNHLKFLEETITPIVLRKNIGGLQWPWTKYNLIAFEAYFARKIFSPNLRRWVISAFFLDGKNVLVAANVGDARVVIVRGGQAIQLTVDHKVKQIKSRRQPVQLHNIGGKWTALITEWQHCYHCDKEKQKTCGTLLFSRTIAIW